MTPLGSLIETARAIHNDTWDSFGKRCGFSSHTIAYELHRKQKLLALPRRATLQRLAAGTGIPLRIWRQAAFDSLAAD